MAFDEEGQAATCAEKVRLGAGRMGQIAIGGAAGVAAG
jgi:hypothetical protein